MHQTSIIQLMQLIAGITNTDPGQVSSFHRVGRQQEMELVEGE